MRPRILLIGANGQVAWELRRSLGTLGDLIVAHRHDDSHRIDLAQPQTIAPVVQDVQPDWIINAAAYTAVDKAEEERELAFRINAEAVGALAEQARRVGAALVHYSTDYVFDGRASRPYVEDAPTHPQSVYGRSKLQGEQALRETGIPHLILRTSWVYGARGHNFFLTMRRLARERSELGIVADQVGAPTWSRHIAEATAQILVQLGQDAAAWQQSSGTYHLVSSGQCAWFDFAKHIIDHQRAHETVATQVIKPITTDEYPLPAPRPAYSVMSNDKLARTFGVYMPDWSVGLDLVLGEVAGPSQ